MKQNSKAQSHGCICRLPLAGPCSGGTLAVALGSSKGLSDAKKLGSEGGRSVDRSDNASNNNLGSWGVHEWSSEKRSRELMTLDSRMASLAV